MAKVSGKLRVRDAGVPGWVLPVGAVLALGGLVGIVYVMYHALFAIPAHMPSGALTVFTPPNVPTGNSLNLYESYRIYFLHVPSAYSAATVSGVMFIGGILALMTKKQHWEGLIAAAAQVGLAACLITMATGYFWGDFAWVGNVGGWNFSDPRLNATLVLWLSYLALLLVRASIDDPERRRVFTAVYGLLTVPLYPMVNQAIKFFGKVVHPINLRDLVGDSTIGSLMNTAAPCVVAFFAGLLLILYAQQRISASVRDAHGRAMEMSAA